MTNEEKPTTQSSHQKPEKWRTNLGLYVTSREAYEMWKAEPERIKILDVRTPEEYWMVGHAEMARNIPVAFVRYKWNHERNEYANEPNQEFLSVVKNVYNPTDTILVTCRSGERSAVAINIVANGGYASVYNIIDGFEGDKVNDPESAYHGKRMKNGWKNSGLPWTYDVNLDLFWLPDGY
jgi:rhodanese-related sulfurtransferase